MAVLALLAAAVRFGPTTPVGRSLVQRAVNGAKVGALGRLRIEGLTGDPWSDFSIARVSIDDPRGPWLRARAVRVRWDWRALLRRQLDIEEIDAAKVTVLRAPTPTPSKAGPRKPPPLSVRLTKLAARLELEPAFSARYGLYDVAGAFDLARSGAVAGKLAAASLTHVGDRLDAAFDLGRAGALNLVLDAHEAKGGAIAGSLGLPADQPFLVDARARGGAVAGRFVIESRSGALTPLQASGGWTAKGARAEGRVDLTASRFLAAYRRALGPQARFRLEGVRRAGEIADIALNAASD
ncbi:MAG: translocation/assembly module TamB domain-containing protein, partial [Caulobacteraceae bacterium]